MRIIFDLRKMSKICEMYLEHPLYATAEELSELGISILTRAEEDSAVSEEYFQKIGRSVFGNIYTCCRHEECDFDTFKLFTIYMDKIVNEFKYTAYM